MSSSTPYSSGGITLPAGQLGGTNAAPTVVGITETGGPTGLTFGAVVAGQLLRRSGATLVGDAPPYASVYIVAAQSISASTFTKVLFDTVAQQSADNPFAVGTSLFTAPRAGRYLVTTAVGYNPAVVPTSTGLIAVYKNGAEAKRGWQTSGTTGESSFCMAQEVICALNDTLGVYVFENQVAAAPLAVNNQVITYAHFSWLGV